MRWLSPGLAERLRESRGILRDMRTAKGQRCKGKTRTGGDCRRTAPHGKSYCGVCLGDDKSAAGAMTTADTVEAATADVLETGSGVEYPAGWGDEHSISEAEAARERTWMITRCEAGHDIVEIARVTGDMRTASALLRQRTTRFGSPASAIAYRQHADYDGDGNAIGPQISMMVPLNDGSDIAARSLSDTAAADRVRYVRDSTPPRDDVEAVAQRMIGEFWAHQCTCQGNPGTCGQHRLAGTGTMTGKQRAQRALEIAAEEQHGHAATPGEAAAPHTAELLPPGDQIDGTLVERRVWRENGRTEAQWWTWTKVDDTYELRGCHRTSSEALKHAGELASAKDRPCLTPGCPNPRYGIMHSYCRDCIMRRVGEQRVREEAH